MIDAGEELDEELENIRNLVANGLGVAPEYVSIMRTSFKVNEDYQKMLEEQAAAEAALEEAQADSERRTIMIIAGIVAAVLLAGLVVMAILMRRRRLAYEAELARLEQEREMEEQQRLLEAEELREKLSEPDSPAATNLRAIQELASENPEMVAQLLRNWLTDDFH